MVQTTVNGLTPAVLGECGIFEEVQVGAERYNFFKHCPKVGFGTGGIEYWIIMLVDLNVKVNGGLISVYIS